MCVVMLITEVTTGESLGCVDSYCGEHPRGREVELKESIRYIVLKKMEIRSNSDDNSG